MMSCQNKLRTQQEFWHFLISKKAVISVPTIGIIVIIEQPILLTKSNINRPSYKFSKYNFS